MEETDSKLIAAYNAISLLGFTPCRCRYNVGATELFLKRVKVASERVMGFEPLRDTLSLPLKFDQ
jgi:hypothetical protein